MLTKKAKRSGDTLDPLCPTVETFSLAVIDAIISGTTEPDARRQLDEFEKLHPANCERCRMYAEGEGHITSEGVRLHNLRRSA